MSMTGQTQSSTPLEQVKPCALIVEDDGQIAYLLQFILSRDGFDVTVIKDGRAAREAIAAGPPPTLVTLDIMLPYVE
jgi:DNA-binding response OmpR family regulator